MKKLFILGIILVLISLSGISQTTALKFDTIPYSSLDWVASGRASNTWFTFYQSANIPDPAKVTWSKSNNTRELWQDFEVTQGNYTFTAFDQEIRQSIDSGQTFSFGIQPICSSCRLYFEGGNLPVAGGGILGYPQYLHNLMQAEGTPDYTATLNGNTFWVPNWNSANYLARLKALYAAVQAHINSTSYKGIPYTSVVTYIDVRGFGDFGEWHIDWGGGAGTFPTEATYKNIIDAHINNFPNNPLVAIVNGFNTMGGTIPVNTAGYLLTATNNWGRIGWRSDHAASREAFYANYTYANTNTYLGIPLSQYILNQYKFAPIVGEPYNDYNAVSDTGAQCAFYYLPTEVQQFHYMQFSNENLTGHNDACIGDNYRLASKLSGYRLQFKSGSVSSFLTPGSTFNLTLNWSNIGVAPDYEVWNTNIELRTTTGTVVWTGTSSFVPKLFLPGNATISDNFALPSGIANGSYSLYLIIRDPLGYRKPLQLANVAQQSDGSYKLTDIQVTGTPQNPPTVNAGTNQLLTLPTNSTTLSGTATPVSPSTSIKTYLWTYVSGPATFSIATPGASSTALTGLVQGVYVFKLTATDNNNLSNSATVQITVNQKPTVNAGSAQTILLPTNNVTLSGTATPQPGGTIASYLWTKTSGPATFTITTPTAKTTTVTGLIQGVYVFTLTATDNNGNSGFATVTITVNQKPTANAGSNQSITLPVNSVTLTGSGTAQPGGTITAYNWVKTSGPSTFTITSPSASSTTVTNLVQGTYVFTLTVTDNNGNTGTSTVTITANPANAPPISNAGTAQSITLPVNSVNLSGTGTPVSPATSITNYLWTKTSGPASGTITSPTSSSTSVTGLSQGTYVFSLTVTDNNGLTGSSTVTITVNAAHLPPTANAGPNKTIQLPVNNVTLVGSGTPIAPATSITTYAWTKTAGPTTFTITSPASSTTNVTGLVQGTYTFTLTVTDNNGLQGSSIVTVIVNAANQSPTANPGSPQTITLPVSSVSLTGSGNFFAPATSITTYAWVKISGPASGTITSPSSASTTVTGLTAGTYVYRLTVTDNNGLTGSANVTITVNPANLPPTANAGTPQTITLPVSSVTLTGSGTPILPATSITTYAWTQTFGTSVTITSPSSVTTTVTGFVAGTYIFQLTVTDNNGLTGSSTVQITVNPAPNPPIVNAGSNQTLLLPTNAATLTGTATPVSPATSISNYLWTKFSGPATFTIASPTTASTGISNLVQGVYVFKLTATDNNGNASSATVQVTVNQIPTVSAGSPQTILLPVNSVTLHGVATAQPGGTISSLLWVKLSGPASFTIAPPNTVTTIISNLVQGVYVFKLTATDNVGNSNSSTVQITVNQKPVSNAGVNQVLNLPTNSTTLNGSGTPQPGGSIVSYAWSKTSGPATFTINSPTSASTIISNLIQGVYVFTLIVTDNNGNTGTSSVTITVNATNPIVNPGSPQTITLPVNSVSLTGIATAISPATSIVSYLWSQTSGPTGSVITTPNAASTTVTGLTQGVYIFSLKATDNTGLFSSSPVTITVNTFISNCNCIIYNIDGANTIIKGVNAVPVWGSTLYIQDSLPHCAPPRINLFSATVTLPNNAINLPIVVTDANGSNTFTYLTTQLSGNTASITNPTTASPTVTNLTAGVAVFNVQVTDGCGAMSNNPVTITTIPAPTTSTAVLIVQKDGSGRPQIIVIRGNEIGNFVIKVMGPGIGKDGDVNTIRTVNPYDIWYDPNIKAKGTYVITATFASGTIKTQNFKK